MKILLDSCMSGRVKSELTAAGHDVQWTGDWARDPGDEEILAAAHRDHRILVTLDKDFGDLAVVRGLQHSGIIRLVGLSLSRHTWVCLSVLSIHSDELLAGALITAEPGRIRIRPAES